MNKTREYLIMPLIILLIAVSSLSFVLADESEITQGTLITYDAQNQTIEVPLKHTNVNAEISGMISDVEVTQIYYNTFQDPIEAIYVFPLPNDAAVYSMTMKIGNRTINGVIKEREEAKEIYEQAKAEGKRTSLLEQERPNIFTQSVANIMPGDEVIITIKYVNELKYDNGTYEFVFPMVVGPRYIPGDQIGKQGTGWSYDTNKVPDASRITPPVLKPTERSGHDISIEVSLNAGIPIEYIRSKSHKITADNIDDSSAEITLSSLDSIPNKDFILEYDVAGDKPEYGLLIHKGQEEKEGFFTLIFQPPKIPDANEITPKEMIFVVDTSGSMSGFPVETAKAAMREAISRMNPGDSFQILRFSETASGMSPLPLPNTPENVQKGLKFVDEMQGSGGTRMIEGIKAALSYPEDPKRMRIVFFMTDGYIGNEDEILAAIQDNLGEARIFPLGVGSSVNRYLIDNMAKLGKGTAQYVRQDENPTQAVQKFYDRISSPILTDISIDWGALNVEDIYPQQIPDMFSSKPVVIHGKFLSTGSDLVEIKGKLGGRETSIGIPVKFEDEEEHSALPLVWARNKIADLMDQMNHGEEKDIVDEITRLGLEYSLMTKYTSFVAVEEVVQEDAFGRLKTVAVPVPMPEGVSYEGVFGEEAEQGAVVSGSGAVTTASASGGILSSMGSAAKEAVNSVSSGKNLVADTSDYAFKRESTLGFAKERSTFSKTKSFLPLLIVLALVMTLISWTTFRYIAKKKKNIMLVSFHEAKTKKMAQAIANESCKKILDVLSEGEQTESEIAKKLEMGISRVHYNLKVLVDANLVHVKSFSYSEKGREMYHYSLTDKYLVIGPPAKSKEK